MAEMEIEELEDKLPGYGAGVKLLLVPADPDDSKNVILEIGRNGRDEACLFAGDLFRMYAKFCERKGWKVEVTNANEGTAGDTKKSWTQCLPVKVCGIMKYESGAPGATWQQVPATETQGRGAYFGSYRGGIA